jgi:hypothetical protein
MIVRCVAPAVVWTMHETGVHSAGEKDGVHEGKTGLLTGIFPPLHACLLLFFGKGKKRVHNRKRVLRQQLSAARWRRLSQQGFRVPVGKEPLAF